MNSVRDLFLEFQECRDGRNSEEGGWGGGGGGGGGRWLTSAASHYYVLYPLRKSKSSGLPNQGLTSTALWRHEDFSQRAFYSHYRPTDVGLFQLTILHKKCGTFS